MTFPRLETAEDLLRDEINRRTEAQAHQNAVRQEFMRRVGASDEEFARNKAIIESCQVALEKLTGERHVVSS